jgi:putative heme transporter
MSMTAPAPVAPDTLVPPWLVRLAAGGWRVLVTIAFALVLGWLTIQLGTVAAAIVVAVIIAATFAPFVKALRQRGWSRTRAAAAVSVGALAVIGLGIALLAIAFLPYVVTVANAIQSGLTDLRAFITEQDPPDAVMAIIDVVRNTILTVVDGLVSALVAPAATVVTIFILGAFLMFFLLLDGDRAWDWLTSGVSGWRRERLTESGRVALDRVGGYLRGTAILSATDAISDFLFLWLLGVPLAGPLSVLVFFGGFIPYVGGFITTSILVIVTWTTNGPADVVILLVLITIMNIIQGNILAPVIYGRTVDVHPALVLIALPAGAALFGIIGLFAALPFVAFVLTIAPAVIDALDIDPEERGSDHGTVPTWLDRLAQWSWRGLVIVALAGIAVAVAVQLPAVVLPIVLALVFGATLSPAVDALVRRGWRQSLAALAVTLGTALAIVLILGVTVASLAGSTGDIAQNAGAGAEATGTSIIGVVNWVRTIGAGIASSVVSAISAAATLGVILLLATLLTFYFLRDGAKLWHGLTGRLEEPRRSAIAGAGSRAVGVLGGYMVGTGAISLFGAATQLLIMLVLGIPYAIPLAVLSLFGGFIPYIGSFITTGLAFLVTVQTGDTTDIIVMRIFTVVFNIVQGNVVAPIVYGRAVNLHPAVVLMAIPAGNEIAGIIGMFLVVPILGVVASTWRTVLQVVAGTFGREVPPEVSGSPDAAEPPPPTVTEADPEADRDLDPDPA